jgi:tetratricopeptide (TPR) repeat protein
VLEAMRGNFDEGRRLQESAVNLFRELGHDVDATTVDGHTGAMIELLAGDPAAAERCARRSYGELERMGEVGYRANTAAYLSKALAELGRFDEALELAEAARSVSGLTDVSAQFEWRVARGRALAGLGRLEEARACLERGVEILTGSDFLADRGAALLALARVVAAKGETDASRALAEEALAAFELKGVVVEAARVRTFLSSLG